MTIKWQLVIVCVFSLLSACVSSPTRTEKHVVVVGAGIVGASIAYHLADSGAKVTVIDKKEPANQASRGTFAWINATYAKQPRYYHRLSQQSVSYWRELATTLDLPVRWGGSLEWFAEQQSQEKLVGQIAEQALWGEPARMVMAEELATLAPNVNFSGVKQVALSGNDGHVDPIQATRILLDAAVAKGASLKFPCKLEQATEQSDDTLRLSTSCGELTADQLVLATGAAPNASSRFAGIDIPQRTTPGFIVVTKPAPMLLDHIIAAPGVHLYQRADGRFVLGEQGGPPNTEAHDQRLRLRPTDFPVQSIASEHAQRILTVAKGFVPKMGDVAVEHVYIGWRPLPIDGHPVLGHSPERDNVYIAIMHSGVTLAPIVGRLVAEEVLSGPVDQLRPFRPDRKFEQIRRY